MPPTLALLALLACHPDAKETGEPEPDPFEGWLRGDLHFHTNYSDDALEQGGDWMGPALDIAAAWSAPEWVAAFPELEGDHLDFVAVTDHRTTAGLADPDFAHDELIVIGGEEFGSDGHAGIWGLGEHVPHEPQGDEPADQRIQDAVEEAHAQGALFSPNHPLYAGDLWGWTARGFDALEVWNGAWGALSAPSDEETLDAWVAANGVENPVIRVAARASGQTQCGQALRFWQGWLSLGAHVPPVGGGDRHMIFPAGMPTTWVRADEASEAGVLDGIRAGATFVSRSPMGPRVLLSATVDGVAYPMGSALPGASEVEVRWVAARAAGGELRLVAGAVDEALPDPEVVERVALTEALEEGSFVWSPPAGGGWLHAVLVDPLPEVPAELESAKEALTTFPEDDGLAALIGALGPLVELEQLFDPSVCDPAGWDPWRAMCMPVDAEPYGTFYLADPVIALLSAEFEDGVATGYAMGAVSAAFHTAPDEGW